MANIHTAYWDRGLDQVERMTGLGRSPSAAILSGSDIRDVCLRLDIGLPVASLLDVGCGTGRLVTLAADYLGADISPSAITYCHQRGVSAVLIDGPEGLDFLEPGRFAWVWACSVFTHISREEQQGYLAQFARLAPRLLVDILPGDPGRSADRWGADEADFRRDLVAAGFVIGPGTVDVVDGSGSKAPRHRYFVGVRA
jgi:SAM-dependent methyltransferase